MDRVTRAMARLGVEFEAKNPLTSLIEDHSRGALRKDVLDERVLSTIVEFKIQEEKLDKVLPAIKEVAGAHRVRLLPRCHQRASSRGPCPCA